jgi:hypothetical protein
MRKENIQKISKTYVDVRFAAGHVGKLHIVGVVVVQGHD